MSKKTYWLAGALIVVVIAGGFVYQQSRKNNTVVAVANETIIRPDLGLSFTYPSGEDAFTMVESLATSSEDVLQAFVMMPTAEYFDFEATKEGRETPAAMSVFVFTDTSATTSATSGEPLSRVTRLQNWATTNTSFTSYLSAITPPEMTEIDGVNAIHYRADGLYQQDIYLVIYQGRIYMFTTQFNTETDLTYTTFQTLIASILFD